MNKLFKITAWHQVRDDWDHESVGAPYATLEEAKIAAQAFWHNREKRPYSMSITDGVDIWKWKVGREWELQHELTV